MLCSQEYHFRVGQLVEQSTKHPKFEGLKSAANGTSGLYHKHNMIVSNAASIVSKLRSVTIIIDDTG